MGGSKDGVVVGGQRTESWWGFKVRSRGGGFKGRSRSAEDGVRGAVVSNGVGRSIQSDIMNFLFKKIRPRDWSFFKNGFKFFR